MSENAVIVKGVVHGRTIELEQDSGLADGQSVTVTLRPVLKPGDGVRRAVGSWAEGAEQLDEFVEQVYRDRKDDRPEPTALRRAEVTDAMARSNCR